VRAADGVRAAGADPVNMGVAERRHLDAAALAGASPAPPGPTPSPSQRRLSPQATVAPRSAAARESCSSSRRPDHARLTGCIVQQFAISIAAARTPGSREVHVSQPPRHLLRCRQHTRQKVSTREDHTCRTHID
jgi:hypothetical protein